MGGHEPSAESDAALVDAIAEGSEGALAEAYRRHAGGVFGLARRILDDVAVAEDIVQEIFLRLWRQPRSFDPDRGSLRSYLLAQAHGRAIDAWRADVSRRRREGETAAGVGTVIDVEMAAWEAAVSGMVKRVLAGLPLDERLAIYLAYFRGLTYREVAVLLELPEGTVKSRIRVGLRRMRERLADAGVHGARA